MAYSKVTGLLAAVLLSGTIICSAGAVRAADKVEAPEEYLDWLDDLKEEMIDRGISKKTIKKVYAEDYYHPEPEVVKIDRNQTRRPNIRNFILCLRIWKGNTAFPLIIWLPFGPWKAISGGISAIIRWWTL